jgi:hypothetical protein
MVFWLHLHLTRSNLEQTLCDLMIVEMKRETKIMVKGAKSKWKRQTHNKRMKRIVKWSLPWPVLYAGLFARFSPCSVQKRENELW